MTKKIALVLLVLLVGILPAAAQNQQAPEKWTPKVTISGGEDAISSGITAVLDLTKADKAVQVAFQSEQSWVLVGKSFKLGKAEVNFSASAGHQQGSPWVGPYATITVPLTKNITFSSMQWPCWFLGREPEKWRTEVDGIENPESMLLGYLGTASLGIGPVSLNYGWLNFLDDEFNHLPGVAYSKKVDENFTISASVTRNVAKERWMYYIGVSWSPKR